MSRQRPGLVVQVLQNFFNSIKPRQTTGKLVGTDYLGNSYFEVTPPAHSTKSRPSRYYVPKGGDESKFDEALPTEWEAWLRLRRNEPPSAEEIDSNLKLALSAKLKALELDKKYKGIEGDEPEQIVTGVKDFPKYGEYEQFPGKKPVG